MAPQLHIFETPEETARAVAALLVEKALEKSRQSLPFNIAISGGSTPKLLFHLLASEFATKMPWNVVRIFFVDERCVAPTHAESNFGMAYENLLSRVPIHEANVFRMQGEADPEKEAARYQALLREQLPLGKGFPRFDFVLLGMGDDGHTASIFPDNLALLHSSSLVAVAVHPATGQKRITLTGSVINEASEVVFLATGSAKAGVLEQIVCRQAGFEQYPAAYMHSDSGAAVFFVDRSAARSL